MATPADDPDSSERIRRLSAEREFVTKIHDHLTELVGVGVAAHDVSAQVARETWFREAVEHLRLASKAFEARRVELEGLLGVIPPKKEEPEK
jgi:hypothetical protein